MKHLFLIFSAALVAAVTRSQETPPAPAASAPATLLAAPADTNAAAVAKEPTVVTSQRLQVDYAQNMGTFEGNVLAVDPQISVRADRMVVTFITTNSTRRLKQIVASGAVMINQGDKKSTSDEAVYTTEDGKVILTGAPKVITPGGTVSGKKITFWRDLQKMDVESDTQLVIFPDELKQDPKPADKVEPPK